MHVTSGVKHTSSALRMNVRHTVKWLMAVTAAYIDPCGTGLSHSTVGHDNIGVACGVGAVSLVMGECQCSKIALPEMKLCQPLSSLQLSSWLTSAQWYTKAALITYS
jgi:hypothetical protein